MTEDEAREAFKSDVAYYAKKWFHLHSDMSDFLENMYVEEDLDTLKAIAYGGWHLEVILDD